MTATMLRFGDVLGSDASLFFIMAGLIYGLLGWRLVRYLAVVDAIVLGVLGATMLSDAEFLRGSAPMAKLLGGVLVLGLPVLAWRLPRWAVMCMGGGVGFVLVQLVLGDSESPELSRWLLGLVGAGFAMGMHLTLHRQSAVVVTGVHGGWLVVAGMVLAAASGGGVGGNLIALLTDSYTVSLGTVAVFSAIMIAIQWSDLEKAPEPG